ncbi:MAG: hypothetical protein WA549_03055 [Thermoplasmata archaeon]
MTSGFTQAYNLDTAVARRVYQNRRVGRYLCVAAAVGFAILTAYAAIGLPRAIAKGSILYPYLAAFALAGFITFFTAGIAIVSAGRPATELILSHDGFELQYPGWPRNLRLRWDHSRFLVVVRDFRDHPTPAAEIVQIERIGRLPFWLQPPTSPLTAEALQALLAKARSKGLTVTDKKGSTFFDFWPNSVITIQRSVRS